MHESVEPKARRIIQEFYAPGFHNCFGCGRNNPRGLALGCWEEGNEVVGEWTPEPHFQGPAGMLHGGITALLMDEVGSAAAFVEYHRRAGRAIGEGPPPFFVTATLSVNYHKPVEIDGPIQLRGWTTNREAIASRKAWVECVLRVNGEDAAGASILFVRTTAEQYGDSI